MTLKEKEKKEKGENLLSNGGSHLNSCTFTYCDHRQELSALSMLFWAKSSIQSGSSIDPSEMDPQARYFSKAAAELALEAMNGVK